MTRPAAEAGFTLVELLISLVLFALIGLAGVTLVESVISVQDRTRTRLDRMAELRRASFLVGMELDQLEAGGFQGTATTLRFRRHGFHGRENVGTVQYRIERGILTRQVDDGPPRRLLSGVGRGEWRYLTAGRGWGTSAQAGLPQGVALDLTLSGDGPTGHFRRVIALPRPL